MFPVKVNDMFYHKYETSWLYKVLAINEKGIKVRIKAMKNSLGMEINVWLGDHIETEDHISVIKGTPVEVNNDSSKFRFF